MKRFLNTHSRKLTLILTLLIATFPHVFQGIGVLAVRFWSYYWLPIMLGVIILLLVFILVHLFKNHKNVVP